MIQNTNLKNALSGIIDIQEKTIEALSGKFYNKTSVNTLIEPISGLTLVDLSGFNERLTAIEEQLNTFDDIE